MSRPTVYTAHQLLHFPLPTQHLLWLAFERVLSTILETSLTQSVSASTVFSSGNTSITSEDYGTTLLITTLRLMMTFAVECWYKRYSLEEHTTRITLFDFLSNFVLFGLFDRTLSVLSQMFNNNSCSLSFTKLNTCPVGAIIKYYSRKVNFGGISLINLKINSKSATISAAIIKFCTIMVSSAQ